MKSPTKLPHDIYEMYSLLGHPEPFDDESADDFQARQLAFTTFKAKLEASNFTIDHLAGVLDPVIEDAIPRIVPVEADIWIPPQKLH